MTIFVRVLWGNEKTAGAASAAQGPSGIPRAEGSKIWGTGENKLVINYVISDKNFWALSDLPYL